jgi:hypothetical protein
MFGSLVAINACGISNKNKQMRKTNGDKRIGGRVLNTLI